MLSTVLRRFTATLLLLLIGVTGTGAYASVSTATTTTAIRPTTASVSANPAADLPLPGSVAGDASPSQLVGELWNRTELYFGSEKPDGSDVTDRQFRAFVDEYVTPRFPDGLTLLTGFGQFRNSSNVIVKERSRVLILLYPRNDRDAHHEIEEIRAIYKEQFQQESVLRVDDVARVSF